ncbi:TPA: bifunctional phosphopantothenoylcysteine decarboxylase/phosphopantothenate--cysteine ligase CoaBC [Candidatus Gastranaerophilales bacterium HUM_10]|nr:MAG TPA: bifunctional phosphopantothenoylcysteine decarboxylase/phosphopantothenate--cysteine ligase CoaBC [Candidatus Gastranaerophilales bacterium HUM_10]
MLENKNILIGITGGIAAYKICTLIRLYRKAGANVRVVLTPNALNFVTKLTLQTLSNNEVYVDNFEIDEYKPEHIALTEADIFVIAPASANTIGKIANGICDNLLLSTACAFSKPILIAPAMNENMWNNPFVQENMSKLKKHGYHIVEPETGFLACGTNGVGRMKEPEEIFDRTAAIFSENKKLKGKKILITAGGTREKIDPVRYITNASSGKMGLALADNAYRMGADVTLISTFKADKPYKNIVTETALEMEKAVKENLSNQDCVIMAAAVSDYRVENCAENKIKKQGNKLTLELVENPDILKSICKTPNKIICGFCAESENLLENAKAKIQKKGCDFLIANDISRKDIGFNTDENEVYIIDKSLNIKHIEKDTKENIARRILEEIFE